MSRFSDFIRNATEAEKREVYEAVMERSDEVQRELIAEWASPATDEALACTRPAPSE